jgi:hypothetical protein
MPFYLDPRHINLRRCARSSRNKMDSTPPPGRGLRRRPRRTSPAEPPQPPIPPTAAPPPPPSGAPHPLGRSGQLATMLGDAPVRRREPGR